MSSNGTVLAPRPIRPLGTRVLATAPPSWSLQPSSAMSLLVTKPPASDVSAISVDSKCTTFGRTDLCTHLIDHPSVSRQHAAIVYSSEGWLLIDLHSSIGTQLNSTKLVPGECYQLYDDDIILLGSSRKQYVVADSQRRRDDHNKLVSKLQYTSEEPKSGVKRPRPESSDANDRPHSTAKPSDPREVRAKHILYKHIGSRNPKSHRTTEKVTISKEEAIKLAKATYTLLKNLDLPMPELSSKFSSIAEKESDCSSFKRGGDLGRFPAEKMQPSFSKASFALQIGEISDVVLSDSGAHIILRTE